MTTAEVAKTLVAHCRTGRFDLAMIELYSPEITSVEGFDMPPMPRTVKGMAAVEAKGKWWMENHIIHATTISDPFLSLEKFAVTFDFDVTFKPTNERKRMYEVAVYTVAGGKIVHEEFLYVD